MSADDWWSRARCDGADIGMFFPETGDPGTAAKRMCAPCPVKQDCLDWATDNFMDGIWGGVNAHDRARIRAQRATPTLRQAQTAAVRAQARRLVAQGLTTDEAADQLGIAQRTVLRALREAA